MKQEIGKILNREFPPEKIKTRPGAGGKRLSYVEGHEVIRRLNEAFEGEWSFEILEYRIMDNEVVVLGKLTVGDVHKMAFGGSGIVRSHRTTEPISIADDLKAASTDALKKAASLLGVGLHLYSDRAPQAQPAPMERPSQPGREPQYVDVPQDPQIPEPGQAARGSLTDRQLLAITRMAAAMRGWGDGEVVAFCEKTYSKAGPEMLTKHEASDLIGFLKERLDEQKNGKR